MIETQIFPGGPGDHRNKDSRPIKITSDEGQEEMKMSYCSSGQALRFIAIALTFFFTCSNCTSAMPGSRNDNPSQVERTITSFSDQELMKLVETASEGEGDQTALTKIKSLPREELIKALTRIRQGLEEDNRQRVQIALVFCYLNYEYPSNRAVIVSAFEKTRSFKGFSADDAVVMINNLIRQGDKNLLRVVFARAGEADTAVAEGIAAIVEEQIRTAPNEFVLSLKEQPAGIRRDVYRLIYLSDDTSDKFTAYLLEASLHPETKQVAKELLKVVRSKARRWT